MKSGLCVHRCPRAYEQDVAECGLIAAVAAAAAAAAVLITPSVASLLSPGAGLSNSQQQAAATAAAAARTGFERVQGGPAGRALANHTLAVVQVPEGAGLERTGRAAQPPGHRADQSLCALLHAAPAGTLQQHSRRGAARAKGPTTHKGRDREAAAADNGTAELAGALRVVRDLPGDETVAVPLQRSEHAGHRVATMAG